jgi:hypothetical protein
MSIIIFEILGNILIHDVSTTKSDHEKSAISESDDP